MAGVLQTTQPAGEVFTIATGNVSPLSVMVSNIGGALGGVPNIASLPTDPSPEAVLWVATVRDGWVAIPGSTLTADGITVVNYAGGANPAGQWVRLLIANATWASQPTWFLHAATGNDENTGIDVAHPLKTWAELQRRLDAHFGATPLQQPTTVQLLTSLAEYCHLTFYISEAASPNARLVVKAAATAITTTFTGSGGLNAVTAIARGAGGGNRQTINDINTVGADFTTKIGQRIVLTSGANVGAIAYIAKSTGATQAFTSAFCSAIDPATTDGTTLTQVNPAVNDQYVLQTLPSVFGLAITGFKSSGNASADRVIYIVSDIQIGPGSAGTPESGSALCETSFSADDQDTGLNALICAVQQCILHINSLVGHQCFANNNCYQGNAAAGVFGCSTLRCQAGTCIGQSFTFTPRPINWIQTLSNDFLLQGGGQLTLAGGVVVQANGVGVFDCTGDAVGLSSTSANIVQVRATAAIYGNGNTGVGLNVGGGIQFLYTVAPTVTGTAGDAKVGGALITYAGNSATNSPLPAYDPYKGSAIVLNSATVPSIGSIQRTGINAPVAATAIFSSNPQPGLYRFAGVIVITTDGAAGDTVSLTISSVDTRTTETILVPLTTAAGVTALVATAVGTANNKSLYFVVDAEINSGNPTYAIALPTHTGAGVLSFRMKAERIQ